MPRSRSGSAYCSASAPSAALETEVNVFEVGGFVAGIETADLGEHVAAHEQASSRTKVDLSAKAILELGGVRAAAYGVRVTDRVDHGAGLLNRAVLVEK